MNTKYHLVVSPYSNAGNVFLVKKAKVVTHVSSAPHGFYRTRRKRWKRWERASREAAKPRSREAAKRRSGKAAKRCMLVTQPIHMEPCVKLVGSYPPYGQRTIGVYLVNKATVVTIVHKVLVTLIGIRVSSFT